MQSNMSFNEIYGLSFVFEHLGYKHGEASFPISDQVELSDF